LPRRTPSTACRGPSTRTCSARRPRSRASTTCGPRRLDTKDAIERSKREIREKIQWFLKFAEISTKADEFVEAATMNPAFEESAMFENMVDMMFKDEYDVYVFDTAPTANARRLLGMSKVYGLWVDKMLKSREEAQSLREVLSFTKKKEEDPLMLYLVDFRERIRHARELLTDPGKTAFFFVTLPEALPIAVISRFIDWFTDFGIPVGGVLVNMVIRPEEGEAQVDFVRNRIESQAGHLDEISRRFPGQVRAVVPLYDSDIRGDFVARPGDRGRLRLTGLGRGCPLRLGDPSSGWRLRSWSSLAPTSVGRPTHPALGREAQTGGNDREGLVSPVVGCIGHMIR